MQQIAQINEQALKKGCPDIWKLQRTYADECIEEKYHLGGAPITTLSANRYSSEGTAKMSAHVDGKDLEFGMTTMCVFRLGNFGGAYLVFPRYGIAIEADDVEGGLGYSSLRFEPDIRNSGMGLFAGTGIIGWLNRGWSIAEYRHNYATNFGLGGLDRDYSLIVYDITFGTSAWSAFWRLMLPLLVVMVMVPRSTRSITHSRARSARLSLTRSEPARSTRCSLPVGSIVPVPSLV